MAERGRDPRLYEVCRSRRYSCWGRSQLYADAWSGGEVVYGSPSGTPRYIRVVPTAGSGWAPCHTSMSGYGTYKSYFTPKTVKMCNIKLLKFVYRCLFI